MTINSSLIKNVLQSYDRHLANGRRLTRLSKYLRDPDRDDPHGYLLEARRKQLVEKVAREIVENLITSGSQNPVTREIKQELNQEMGMELIFHYPPTGEEMKILKPGDQGPEELTLEEKDQVLRKLWEVTLDKVNETML